MFKYIVIYYNPNKKDYYYKVVGSSSKYYVGYKNSYGHEVLFIINVYDIWYPPKRKLRKKVLTKIISFLQNKLEKL